MTDAGRLVDQLRTLADLLERQAAEAPPSYRPGIGLALEFARNLADSFEDDDDEGMADAYDRLERVAPLWLRRLPQILPLVAIDGDPPRTVTISWERVPPDLRDAVVSYANLIVDAVQGRYSSGGRGKKKSAQTG